MNSTRRSLLHLVPAAAAAFALAACKDSPAGGDGKPAGGEAVSLDTIAAQAQGFSVGPAMATRVAYVFFDPQCPHCAALWESAKPLKQVRFVWLPVGLLGPASGKQGAAILAAPDPAAAMEAHERSMAAKQGGITAMGVPSDKEAAVAANGKLMDRYGFASVPVIVTKGAGGQPAVREGSMPTADLAAFVGVAAP
jgi:thiol:disulfide interchange protein DsbG